MNPLETFMIQVKDALTTGDFFNLSDLLDSSASVVDEQLGINERLSLISKALEIHEESIAVLLLVRLFELRLLELPPSILEEMEIMGNKRDSSKFLNVLNMLKCGDMERANASLKMVEDEEMDLQRMAEFQSLEQALLGKQKYPAWISDREFNTVLHRCIRRNDLRLPYAYSLLGAPVSAQNKSGNTALHVAVDHNKLELAEVLLQIGVDPTLRNSLGQTARDIAIQSGQQQMAQLLDRYSPGLVHGYTTGDYRAVVHALRRWVNPLVVSDCGPSWPSDHPIVKSVQQSKRQLLFVHHVLANNTSGVKRMLRSQEPQLGADHLDVNMTHPDSGITPLAVAALRHKNLKLVELLLRAGATPDVRVTQSQTPLPVAAIGQPDCPIEIIWALLASGSWEARDKQGFTVFLRGIVDDRSCQDIRSLLRISRCLCLRQRTEQDGWTGLQLAERLGREELVSCIREELMRLVVASAEGCRESRTALMSLAVGFVGAENLALDPLQLRLMEDAGNSAPVELYKGFLAKLPEIERRGADLMEAAQEGKLAMVKILNDAAYVDKNGYTALTRGIVHGHIPVVAWLMSERPDLRLISDMSNRYPLHYAYALPNAALSSAMVALVLGNDPDSVQLLTDKNGVLPCKYQEMRDEPAILEALNAVRALDPWGRPRSLIL